jgi:nucleoid DNA-binding protein
MNKEDLAKTIVERTDISSEKANIVLDQMFVSRAIPSVLKDIIISNIAKGAGVTTDQAQEGVSAVFGKLTEDPAIFELASHQLVAAWFNDCDGCNACGAALVARELQLQESQKR